MSKNHSSSSISCLMSAGFSMLVTVESRSLPMASTIAMVMVSRFILAAISL